MKTIIIILVVLFAFVSIFFTVMLVKSVTSGKQKEDTPVETAAETEEPPETSAQTLETAEQTPEETGDQSSENIEKIEMFLDGDRENGIYMGDADYNLPSEDAASIYGQDFGDFGFELIFDTEDYPFEPGSTHSLYIYTYIPAYGWEYTRKEIVIPGEPPVSDTIKMSLEGMGEGDAIAEEELKDVLIKGWAADLNVSENTGISKVEVFLDGPRNFGKFLGDADYGLERVDVGNAYGNSNYNNSGYMFSFDASNLEPGSTHKIYVYAYSPSGAFQYLTNDITIEGDLPEPNTVVKADTKFGEDYMEVSGWAINKEYISEGVPRSLDIEYSLKKIVFVSNKSGNEDIWSMNLDGSELTQLTTNSSSDVYPAISPDGKKISYASQVGNAWQLFTMNWDGTDKKQVTSLPYRTGYPSWSFDGRYLVFEMFIDENWEIYIMENDGSNIKRLTKNPGIEDWHPYAHPFEYTVIYESGYSGSEQIWEIGMDGENNDRISDEERNYRVPKYSIDARFITFMGYDGDGIEQVYVMDSDGEDINQLTSTPDGARLPCFSPDNKLITFNTKANAEIFIMNTDGSDKRQITSIPGEDSCAVFMYQAAE